MCLASGTVLVATVLETYGWVYFQGSSSSFYVHASHLPGKSMLPYEQNISSKSGPLWEDYFVEEKRTGSPTKVDLLSKNG